MHSFFFSSYPRGVKFTLWEGGVRGVGLVHSPLLARQGYVSNKMLHVCDWLPTVISAAGGKHLLKNATSLDGFDAWEMLSQDGNAVRSEILHNIDPVIKRGALRVGDYKLLVGHINFNWGGWYPPYQLPGDEKSLHYLSYSDNVSLSESVETRDYRRRLNGAYKTMWPDSVRERLVELYSFAESSGMYTGPYARLNDQMKDFASMTDTPYTKSFNSDLQFEPERNLVQHWAKSGSTVLSALGGAPVTVHCGLKPANASTNCNPTVFPCLYHIPSDPCEYNNIAMNNTEIVSMFLASALCFTGCLSTLSR